MNIFEFDLWGTPTPIESNHSMEQTKERTPVIVIVTEYFPPTNNAPAARFGPLTEALSKKFKVKVYTSNRAGNFDHLTIYKNLISFPGNTKSLFFRLLFELLYSVETFVKLISSKGDVYYITSPSFFNCISAYFYCRLLKRKYIVDIRDDYPRVFFEHSLIRPSSFLGKALLTIEKKIYEKSSLIIAATEGLRKSILQKTNKHVYLLRNGYSANIFKPLGIKYDEFTLVFHGNLGYFQDLDLIIKLAELVDIENLNIRILVIGKGSEDYKLTNARLPKSLKYLGPKAYKEIPQIIGKAHIGLSFRKPGKISEDSFPVRTYEYMGVNIPIILTPVSEAGSFIESAKIGYQFDHTQVQEILETIKRLKSDRMEYQQLVDNISIVRAQFSNELNCAHLADHLKSIV